MQDSRNDHFGFFPIDMPMAFHEKAQYGLSIRRESYQQVHATTQRSNIMLGRSYAIAVPSMDKLLAGIDTLTTSHDIRGRGVRSFHCWQRCTTSVRASAQAQIIRGAHSRRNASACLYIERHRAQSSTLSEANRAAQRALVSGP